MLLERRGKREREDYRQRPPCTCSKAKRRRPREASFSSEENIDRKRIKPNDRNMRCCDIEFE